MPERLECEVLQKEHYTNTLTYLPTYTSHTPSGKPDGVVLHYTCPTPEAVHWASLSTGT